MNPSHFDRYSDDGTLMYIISQDKLYNCFISRDPEESPSEFSDQKNDHSYDLKWMLKNFPALRSLVMRVMSHNDWAVVFSLEENPSEQVQLAAVQQNGNAIEYIDNPSEAVQLAAVQQNGNAIKYIIRKGIIPSERVQLAAVQQDWFAIEYIDNPSEEVQLAAVQQNLYVIGDIKNPNESVQITAVQQDGTAIRYIENPSERVQLAAVQQDGSAIKYIKNPTPKVKKLADELEAKWNNRTQQA